MSSIRERLGLNNLEQKSQTFSIRERLGITQESLEEEKNNQEIQQRIKEENSTVQSRKKTGLKWIDKNLKNIDTKTYENAQNLSNYQNDNSAVKLGSTVGDLAVNVGKGFVGGVENVVDLGRYGVAGVADLLGAKNYANDVRERAKQNTTDILFSSIENTFDKNSLLKKNGLIENVAQGVGQIGAIVGSGGLLPKSISTVNVGKFAMPTTSILTGAGGAMTDAYNNGATNGQAFAAGIGGGLVEGFSESLFDGLGSTFSKKFGGGALDDVIVKRLTDKISNKTIQTLAQSGLKATGEGFEEIVSGLGNAAVKKLTYMNKEDIFKLIEDEDLLNSFVVGTLTSAVAQTPSTINSIKTGKSYINLEENSKVNNSEFNNQNKVNDNLQQSTNNTDIFSKQVDEVLKGTYPKRDMLIVSKNTPQVLQDIGLNNLPITMTQKHLQTIMNSNGDYKGVNYHDLGIDLVKQLPNAISNPLNVLKSNTDSNSIVVITELVDKQDRPVIASIKVDGKGQINDIQIDTNVMTSAYGRNNYDKFMQENIAKGNLLYDIDEGIIKKSDATDKVQFPMRSSSNEIASDIPKNTSPISTNDNTIIPTKSQMALPTYNMQKNQESIPNIKIKGDTLPKYSDKNVNLLYEEKNTKILNPNEISKLTIEDANTTPKLPTVNRNKANDGNSKFWDNINDKTNMLNEKQKTSILSEEEIKYYDKITNKESLEKAFEKLNDGGLAETIRWSKQDSKAATATDVAEGWILLKRYSDSGDHDSMVQVAKKMREIGTMAGQTVQAFNIMARMTPEGMVKYAQSELSEAYDNMVKNKSKAWIEKYGDDFDLKSDEVKFIMKTMQEISEIENSNFKDNTIKKLKSAIENSNNKSEIKTINNLIKTLERGDLEYYKKVKLAEIQKLMTDKLPPEKGAGTRAWMRISMLFNPKTQVRNVAGNALIMPINSFGDIFASYADKLIAKKTGVRTTGTTNIKSMLKGIKKGAYEATNDYKMGINTKDMDGNRFEISNGKSFSEKQLIGKALNRTESLLNYVMDVGDRVFSEAAFENSLQNQLVLNNTTEITQEMIDIAHQEALSRTWNDNNNYTKFVLGIRKGLNKVNVNGYGLGDVLIPFAKTPANLTKAIVDYSPAGLVSTLTKGINLKRSLSNGQYNASMQHDFVQSLGKTTAGTMLYVLGLALAKAGITSGESDDDKDTANFLKNTLGISSYSIKIGNKSFTYDWAQPLAAPLSITTNIVNSKKNGSQALLEGIISSLDSAGSTLLEQSFLQSINDVLSDNDGVVSGIINEVLELPARAVPTFSKQIADLVDGTQRTTFEYGKPLKSAVNSIVAKIPFVSKTLAPTVDTLGREVKKYGGKNNIFNVFLNPANVNTENISEAAKEIYRLYKETGETGVMPRVASYYINQGDEKINMTGAERAKYQKLSGNMIEENIEKLIKSASYSKMSDIDKASIVTNIINYSYNAAKKEVFDVDLSNSYQKAYDYSKIGDIGDYYAFKESIDDTNKDTKKESITNYLIDSSLNDEQLAFLYGSYYSSKETLNMISNFEIPIKEFIKYNSQDFENEYNANGTVSNSKKNQVLNYIEKLNLSIAQKAILYKMKYSSYTKYDNTILTYINKLDLTKFEKSSLAKQLGFSNYDDYLINYIKSLNISEDDKIDQLKNLGFKVYTSNGKIYVKKG